MARRPRRRDEAKERQWRRTVRGWRASGLSVREFCDRQGLSEPSFYAWRRELAERDREAAAAATGTVAGSGGRSRATHGSGAVVSNPRRAAAFVPVRVVPDAAGPWSGPSSPGGNGLEVQFPTGVRLFVPAGCDRALLREVIACCGGLAGAREAETASC